MSSDFPFPALSRFGVEMEYMIVSKDTLRVLPIADQLLPATDTKEAPEIPCGNLHWSNELVRHVIEFKNLTPVEDPSTLLEDFSDSVREANRQLSPLNACLMSGGMHPDFRPLQETVLWPYGNHAIYQRFNEIFDCRGHGWSNLQSTHINVSFGNEEEFVRLHAVIRLLLPLLPALAASSPIVEGKVSPWKSARLHAYAMNCARLPVITGRVIPEPIASIKEYHSRIYAPIAQTIAPWNQDELMEPVWVNARGAIARFDRGSIEIRVLDLQECPAQDLSLVGLVIDLMQALYRSSHSTQHLLSAPQTELENLFFSLVQDGTSGQLPCALSPWYGAGSQTPLNAVEHLLTTHTHPRPTSQQFLAICRQQGNLAERILRAWHHKPNWDTLAHELCQCLASNQIAFTFGR